MIDTSYALPLTSDFTSCLSSGLYTRQRDRLGGNRRGRAKSRSMAQADLRRVERCRRQVDHSRSDLHRAIKEAVASGETYRDVAKAAGLSHQRVAQIVKE